MLVEKSRRESPGAIGGVLSISFGTRVIEEGVTGARESFNLEVLCVPAKDLFELADVCQWDQWVLGAEETGGSLEPLLDGFRAMVGDQAAALLSLLALIGLLASLMGIMFAYGRNMYSLSRAGYYPRWLSLTGARKTPWVALVFGAVLGFLALVIVQAAGGDASPAGAIVLNIAVWGAVLAYFLQMVSFIVLRKKFPNAVRPYKSPWGLFGAYSAAIIAAVVFFGLLLNPAYLLAIVAIIVVYAVIFIAFAIYGRHRLVLSPEEEYALSGGLHGDPQKEGYDAMEGEVFGEKRP